MARRTAATSIDRLHAEWLSLIEVSGPFLSLTVLRNAFPQGLDAHDPEVAARLRIAYGEWTADRERRRPDPAIHRAWVRFVLNELLELPDDLIRADQGLPPGLEARFPEHGETLRPDLAVVEPPDLDGRGGGKARLLVQVYDAGQDLDRPVKGLHWPASPGSRMAELLRAAGVRLGLVTNGERWMLVDAPRGETAAFVSWYATLWLEEQVTLRAFRSMLRGSRFFGVAEEQTLERLLERSKTDQAEVTTTLGAQVRQAVELLVYALDRVDRSRNGQLLRDVPEPVIYEAAITVMMRLVFLLFAEEQRPPLFGGNALYDQHYSLSPLRAGLREAANQGGEEVLERRSDAWSRLLATFRLVHGGSEHEAMRLPAYGGSLFDPDRFPFLEGRPAGSRWSETAAEPLPIDNRTVLHLLDAIQELRLKDARGTIEARRLSFRALDVEQIGHVYESLLEHTARRSTGLVLGLDGPNEPEIALDDLERLATQGEAKLLAALKDLTGRSESALRKNLGPSLASNAGATAVGEGLVPSRPRSGPAEGGTLSLFDPLDTQLFRAACDNDDALWERVKPFAGLVRRDSAGRPIVIPAGSVYVTAGTDRRQQGAHYTPRGLTEPIVQYALEPLVYVGPAEGKPREEWALRPAKALLELKVCDPAMGSGAFLVQTCRYLSERLVEAWDKAEERAAGGLVVTPEGELASGATAERVVPKDRDERLALARRLVVDHCLYGVDKNPLAVEMAKLSLWLVTLQKDRPFTFLDHALRCGDSLLGISDLEQLKRWSLTIEKDDGTYRQTSWFTQQVKRALDEATRLRRMIAATPVEHATDAEEKRRLLAKAEQLTGLIRLGVDLLVAAALHANPKTRETLRRQFLTDFSLQMEALRSVQLDEFTIDGARPTWEAIADLRNRANALLGCHGPFHWPLQFPEVFLSEASSRAP